MLTEFIRVENMGLDIKKKNVSSVFALLYDDFTVYVIMHGSQIGFLAERRVVVS